MMRKQWCIPENDLLITRWISNLEYLEDLNRGMKRFCKTISIKEFPINQDILKQVLCLVKLSGIEIEGED
jgi:hypothetical protein